MKANFYPGPSRVHSKVPTFIMDAYSAGILSVNHRSKEFMALAKNTKAVLHENLKIPSDYEIVFTSSATECWEIIAQSLTKKSSHHFYNGAFGEKWKTRAGNLIHVTETSFDLEEALPVDKLEESDVVCLTQNETSNGTQVSMETMTKLRKSTDQIICVDATSSMAGVFLDFTLADVWYASVQKCFGLPAGLGIMILSPKAVRRAEEINDQKRYNSLPFVLKNWRDNQSPYTPNVLGLYLLHRSMEFRKSVESIDKKITKRFKSWVSFFEDSQRIELLVSESDVRSKTVLTLKTNNPLDLIESSAKAGIIFGKGYGDLKKSTFRIANFPAIKKLEIQKAKEFLTSYL